VNSQDKIQRTAFPIQDKAARPPVGQPAERFDGRRVTLQYESIKLSVRVGSLITGSG